MTHEKQKALITDIIQACAAGDCKGLDNVFMALLALDEAGLVKVAQELNIKIS